MGRFMVSKSMSNLCRVFDDGFWGDFCIYFIV